MVSSPSSYRRIVVTCTLAVGTFQRLIMAGLLAFGLTLATGHALVLNEMMSSNTSAVQDDDGDWSDWVEIYNDGGSAVNLDGYGLTDNPAQPYKWVFPARTINPGEYLVVWCSNKNRINPANPLHTNWAISAGGETIVLTTPGGSTVDTIPSTALGANISLGRYPDTSGDWEQFDVPTPGTANGTPIQNPVADPSFSVDGGIYSSTVSLSLSTATAGATIRYTTNGNEPTTNSTIYSNTLSLNSRAGTTNVYSQIPSNDLATGSPYYEGWQAPNGEVFKIHVIRARAFKNGVPDSKIVTRSFLVDSNGTSRYSLPIISIASSSNNLFSASTGIYVKGNATNYSQSGATWERPGYMEFFETNGTLAFRDTIGIRLNGNTTRNRPRKALRIYNREPGSAFNYQIYPDKNVNVFKRLILRSSGNDWGQTIIRDAFITSLSAHTGMDRQFSRPAVVFINGEYWGIHNVRDRIDEDYFATHYGLNDDQYTSLEIASGGPSYSWPIYDTGNTNMLADFEDILNNAKTNGFVSSGNYSNVSGRIDISNYIDYQAFEIFSGNTDWPGNNNQFWRSVATNGAGKLDGKWRWILKDLDFGFGLDFFYVPGWDEFYNHNTLAYSAWPHETSWGNNTNGTLLFRKLLENTNFRTDFINRFADHLNTALSVSYMNTQLNAWTNVYGPAMPEHVNRWRQPGNWSNEITRMRNYFSGRTDAVRGHIWSFFNLPGTAPVTVTVNDAAQGDVNVNSIALNTNTPGVTSPVFPWTGTYFRGAPVTLTATPKPGYRFVSWNVDKTVENTLNTDSTAASAYATNWTGGTGSNSAFGHWVFNGSPTWNSGTFVASGWSTNQHPIVLSTPDKRAFALYAHSGDWQEARRAFQYGALAVGDTFSTRIGVDYFSGEKGIALTSGGTNGTEYFVFRAANNGSDVYQVKLGTNNPVSITSTFSPRGGSVFTFKVTRVVGRTHRITIQRDGQTYGQLFTFPGTVAGVRYFNQWTSNGDNGNNLFFNDLKLATTESVVGSDSTAASVYSGGWTNSTGSNSTFGNWTLTSTGGNSGRFIATTNNSTHPMHKTTPDSRSWALYGHSGQEGTASRGFQNGALAAGQTFYAKIGMNFFTGERGMILMDGSTNRFTFRATKDGGGNSVYQVFVGTNTATTITNNLPALGDSMFVFRATRVAGNDYRITIERNGAVYSQTHTFGGTVNGVKFYNKNGSNSDDGYNLFFNELQINDSIGDTTNTATNPLVVDITDNTAVNALATFELDSANRLSIASISHPAQTGSDAKAIEVKALNSQGEVDGNYTGTVTLAVTGPDSSVQYYNVAAVNGIATFTNVQPSALGTNSLAATASGLSNSSSVNLNVLANATLVHTNGNAAWQVATNWNTGAVPGGNKAAVVVPGPTTTNRQVTLSNAVTINSMEFPQGSSGVRNLVSAPTNTSLTFAAQGTNEARIIVGGTGTGFVEYDGVGGFVLSNQTRLTVTNVAGDAEFGGLRLRASWTGPGGLTKDGPGQAVLTGDSKLYSGVTIIEQGVLGITGPSANTNSPSITVMSGGQLRLTSAGNPRVYTFGGPIYLAGQGRSGVSDGSGLGVLGALRYEPGSTNNNAQITTPVTTTADTHVHVPATNTVTFTGTFSGSHEVIKSGGGTLAIAGNPSGFTGTLNITNGTLLVQSNLATNSAITLAGSGKLQGSGNRTIGNLNLNAGGSVIASLGAAPSTNAIFTGKTITLTGASTVNATAATNSVVGRYPIAKASAGNIAGTGTVSLVSAPGSFPASIATTVGDTLYVVLGTTQTETWRAKYGLPTNGSGDGADNADPDGDGIINLIEQAFGLSPIVADEAVPATVTTTTSMGVVDSISLTYTVPRGQTEVLVVPYKTDDLESGTWTTVTPTLEDDSHPNYQVWKATVSLGVGERAFLGFQVQRP